MMERKQVIVWSTGKEYDEEFINNNRKKVRILRRRTEGLPRHWYGRYLVPNGMGGNSGDQMYLVHQVPPVPQLTACFPTL